MGVAQIDASRWLTFKDQKQAVLDDVAAIRNHALARKTIPVYGNIFDVKSGENCRGRRRKST